MPIGDIRLSAGMRIGSDERFLDQVVEIASLNSEITVLRSGVQSIANDLIDMRDAFERCRNSNSLLELENADLDKARLINRTLAYVFGGIIVAEIVVIAAILLLRRN